MGLLTHHDWGMQERLCWLGFPLIRGTVSTLSLSDPFKDVLLLSHCSSCLDLLSKPVQFSGQARRNQSANSASTDETGRNQSAKRYFLDKVRQTRVPDPQCVITLKQVQGQTPPVHLIIPRKRLYLL